MPKKMKGLNRILFVMWVQNVIDIIFTILQGQFSGAETLILCLNYFKELL